jgi:gas vesicle protein
MANEDPIRIPVEVEGEEEAAAGIDRVADALDDLHESQGQTSQSTATLAAQQTAAATRAIEFGSKLAAAASAIQGITSALGIEGRAAGLIGSMTQTSVAMAQLGQQFGPQGAMVGGIVGAAIPAIAAIVNAIEETNERNEEWAERLAEIEAAQEEAEQAIRESTIAIDEQSEALATASDRMREFIRSLSREGLESQAFDTAAQITSLTDRLADVNDELGRMEGSTGAAAAMRILELREEAAQLTTTINGLNASFEATAGTVAESTAPRRGGGGRDDEQRAMERAWQEDLEYARAEAERLEQQLEQGMIEAMGGVADAQAVITGLIAEENEERERAVRLADKQKEAALEQQEAETELFQQQRENVEGQWNQMFEIGQGVTNLLTDAVGQVLNGTKSADEAMLGLLKSFLEFISQFCALKAAAEFADAASSFAKYDYGGGALHIAAGVAFTAVAVATGVGAAQINTAPAAPAEPAKEQPSGGGGGGDIVINYNSPVVTAATYAELGRQTQQMIDAGRRRFGR